VTIDLATSAATFVRLIESSDVFLTDVHAHKLDPLGLSWAALHQRRSSLLMTRVTPFGDSGPFARYEGTNITGLASSGQLKITGDPDKPPLSNFGAQAEYQAGLSAFAGTVANLLLRDATGEGEYLDLSMQDVVATNLEHRSPALNLGLEANRVGLTVSATYGVYACADGWVYVTAFAPALWDRLLSIIDMPALREERFSTQASRLEHNDELQALIASWAITKSSAELHDLALRGYPLTVMTTPSMLLASEQWRNRRVTQRIEHAIAGAYDMVGAPWFEDNASPLAPAPLLGEANEELLMETPLPASGRGRGRGP
jgi:crotonobetainyl-CoA:carnitine CoA-transferase CaiB-like acyl-CoA transferase